jgi:carboxypeptidase family protein
MRSLPILLIVLTILAACSTSSARPLLPQSDSGVIRGVVLDPQGAVIPGAEVHATNTQTGQAFMTKSDDAGAFVLTGVPFGDYSLLITSPGFAKFHTPVTLSKETSEAPHNATMQVTMGEVRIDAHMIDVGSTELVCVVCSYTYFSIRYTDLPFLDRDPQRLVMLQSGVAEHKGNFSIAGRRVENKTALLDGVDNRDPATGRFTASLSLDALAEFNIDYTSADTSVSSSYGQNSAPLLSATSKAGSNQYHGQGLWQIGRTGLNANNFLTNRGALPRDRTMFDQPALTFGGNISLPGVFSGRDRAFFFISYESTRDRETAGRQITAPLASFIERTSAVQGALFRSLLSQGRIPLASGPGLQDLDGDGLNDIGDLAVRSSQSLSRKLALARIDLKLTDKLQLSLRYFRDQVHRLDDFNDSAFTPASPLDARNNGDLAGVQFTALINPSTINDFHFGFLKGRTLLSGAGSDAPQVVAINTPLGVGNGVPEFPEQRENRALVLTDTFSRVAGAHTLSAGAQVIRRNEQYTNQALFQGRVYYADALALITDGTLSGVDPARSIVLADLQQSPESARYRFTDMYGFANDTWRAGPQLVLSYGTSYNLYSGAVYGRKTDRNNFAPFASFAFAPTHSESIILRGGAAILYAPPTRLPYGEIKTTPLYPVATGFARPNEISGTLLPRAWAGRSGVVEIEQQYANDMRTAYTESAFFFVQRSIGARLIIEAGYTSTLGHRLTRAYRVGRGRVDLPASGRSSEEETISIASDGNSGYHSLQVRVTSRERHRLTFQAHYTLSKSIDTASDDRPSMFRALELGPVDENNAALERGPSDFDRRHRAVGFFVWRGPSFDRLKGPWRTMLRDWQLSGIVALRSGPRVSLYSSGDFFGGLGDFNHDGVLNDRLAYIGTGSIQSSLHKSATAADGYFNASLFGAPETSGRQALSRNVLPSPGYGSIDFSVQKKFSLTEAHDIEVRADVFNAANRVNFAPPVTDLVSADFGRSVEAGRARTVRLSLRYSL